MENPLTTCPSSYLSPNIRRVGGFKRASGGKPPCEQACFHAYARHEGLRTILFDAAMDRIISPTIRDQATSGLDGAGLDWTFVSSDGTRTKEGTCYLPHNFFHASDLIDENPMKSCLTRHFHTSKRAKGKLPF